MPRYDHDFALRCTVPRSRWVAEDSTGEFFNRLANLTYAQKRLALFALHVEATVWSKDHDPRFSITMQIDLDAPLSDPQLAADDAPFEAHVGASTRRGTGSNRLIMRWASDVAGEQTATA